VVLVEAAVEGLDPRYAVSGYGVKISRLVAAPLVSLDSRDLRPKMELALRVDHPDPLTYVVTLKPSARFSDGTQVTARDVKATIESITDPRGHSPYQWVWSRVQRMEILGPNRIRFRLKRPHSPFLTDLDVGILPARLVSGHARRLSDKRLVGAGPFRIVRRDTYRIVLEPNPHYFGKKARLDRIVIKTVEDENARLIMLAGGSADFTQNTVAPLLIPAVHRKKDLRVVTGPSVTHTYVGLNLSHPALSNRSVRRALALAIDRKTLVRTKLKGRAALASGILPSFHWAHNPRTGLVPYDPKRARHLLDRAGYPRRRGGRPRFRLTYKTSSNRFRVAIAQVMANMLSKVGVKVEVRPYEWGVFFADIKKLNFEMFSMQMTELAAPDYHYHFFHSSSIPGADLVEAAMQQAAWLVRKLTSGGTGSFPDAFKLMEDRLADLFGLRLPELLILRTLGAPLKAVGGGNRFQYRNPEVDFLLDSARATGDLKVQRELYGRVQELLARDLPFIPLWHEDNVAVTRCEVKGYHILPNAGFGGLVHAHKARCTTR
jgi:peptide/nickel transport system substrate-binding protein